MGNRQLSTDYHVTKQVLSIGERNGYAIVSIDYRLAPETKLPAIISDVEAAFTWLKSDGAKKFHLDVNRMVVVGDSAGGYLTLVTGYRVNPKSYRRSKDQHRPDSCAIDSDCMQQNQIVI